MKCFNNIPLFLGSLLCIVVTASGEMHEFINNSPDAIEVTLSFRSRKCQEAFMYKNPRKTVQPGQKTTFKLGTCPLEKITLRRISKSNTSGPRSAEFKIYQDESFNQAKLQNRRLELLQKQDTPVFSFLKKERGLNPINKAKRIQLTAREFIVANGDTQWSITSYKNLEPLSSVAVYGPPLKK